AGSDRSAGALPAIPNARKCERRTVFHLKVVRLRDLAVTLPLVKSVCKDEAAPLLERVIEARFLFDRFDACVDDALWLFAPRRDQSPLQQRGFAIVAALLNRQYVLRGRDVVTRN